LSDQDRVCPRLDSGIANAPGHHWLSRRLERPFSQPAFSGLDRAAELPALANPDNLLGRNAALFEFVENRAEADRVAADLVEQPSLVDLFGDVRQFVYVLANSLNQGQVPSLGKVLQCRRDLLAPLEHRGMSPGVPPAKLLLAILAA